MNFGLKDTTEGVKLAHFGMSPRQGIFNATRFLNTYNYKSVTILIYIERIDIGLTLVTNITQLIRGNLFFVIFFLLSPNLRPPTLWQLKSNLGLRNADVSIFCGF